MLLAFTAGGRWAIRSTHDAQRMPSVLRSFFVLAYIRTYGHVCTYTYIIYMYIYIYMYMYIGTHIHASQAQARSRTHIHFSNNCPSEHTTGNQHMASVRESAVPCIDCAKPFSAPWLLAVTVSSIASHRHVTASRPQGQLCTYTPSLTHLQLSQQWRLSVYCLGRR